MLRICQPLKDEYYCSSAMYIMVKNNAIDTTVPLSPMIVQSTTVISVISLLLLMLVLRVHHLIR